MRYYPVNLDIEDRRCLVLGGGAVGTRKVLTLLDCGAEVTVVSPDTTERLSGLFEDRKITWMKRSYRSSDLEGMFLVIGATNDEALNLRVYEDAKRLNILCNIADRPQVCNFILPAVVNRGDLIIAISTSGKSPAFAKQLRLEMADRYGEEYAAFLTLMGAIRERLLAEEHAPEAHKPIFEQLISRGLIDLIRTEDRVGINSLLLEILGSGFFYDQLINPEPESR
jgi:precorrin-2 dehydrogenase / sirohydrochlorin ferrochelatase